MNNPFGIDKWMMLFEDFQGVILAGFLQTLLMSLCGLLLALVLGVFFGVLSTSTMKPLRAISRVYVELFQNLPLFILLIFMYNVLPYVNVVLPVFTISVLGVGVYHGAYISEVVRAGVEAVPKGQMEAAQSQGFSHVQAMYMIILPQAVKLMLPMLTNQAVNLVKNTSIASLVAGGELMYLTDSWVGQFGAYGPGYIMAGLMYFVVNFPLVLLANYLEKRAKQELPKKKKTTLVKA